jgi:glycosyltransferase involved in cell wall biosynthesis
MDRVQQDGRRGSDPQVSLVLPAYNEQECIGEAVEAASAALDRAFDGWELIVVDDGSSDRTGSIAAAAADDDPRVRVVTHERNRGYGAAIRSGMAEARGPVVAYSDSDLQFDYGELQYLVEAQVETGSDAVFGYRVYRYDTVLRCMLSWGYNRLVRLLFGVRVRDVDCGFKLFTREAAAQLNLETDDFFVDTEMVAKIGRLGLRSEEVGVRHYPRKAGRTTVRPSDIPRTLLTVVRMWGKLRPFPSSRGKA